MKWEDIADYVRSAFRQAREELVDRGWFGRNPGGAADHFGRALDHGSGKGGITLIDARHDNRVNIDASQRSLSIESGWTIAEPSRERDGPGLER